ncbi:hypothetical protein PVAND_005349 [Polypedilum vanderplanki]|uniref:BTB domain-containing protein n=1 Tax=Polypedilum vanderplanki TaxID=319348 RepID=A0A9J6C0R8_POLVA|nr:hypothetical protein PVAND_005349 [Polypedilum vanderplanki]
MVQYIKCIYNNKEWNIRKPNYTCRIYEQVIFDNKKINFIGAHGKDKSNQDVDSILFQNCKFQRFPRGLIQVFPNLKYLNISFSQLTYIERNDLKEYAQLTDLYLHKNQLVYLSEDLFADMPNLEVIWLQNNNNLLIEPKIFNNLVHLKNLSLSNQFYFNILPSANRGKMSLNRIKYELQKIYENSPMKKFLEAKLKNEFFDDIKNAIRNDDLKDFTINVRTRQFKGHKFILASRSQVFAEIFKNNKDADNLKLNNVSPEVFQIVFDFIYTNELPNLDEDTLVQIITISEQLKIKILTKHVEEELLMMVNTENVSKMLKLSEKFNLKKLKQKSTSDREQVRMLNEDTEKMQKELMAIKKMLEKKEKK